MSHPAQQYFVAEVANRFPRFFRFCRVLEIGSLNINGTVRTLFEGCEYLGIDVVPGPSVDQVSIAHQLPKGKPFDTVISCESLEHDQYWRETLEAMLGHLRPGGLMVITCAGPARLEHGTRTSSPQDSGTSGIEGWADYYRNLGENDFRGALDLGAFTVSELRLIRGEQDLQFWGIKKEEK